MHKHFSKYIIILSLIFFSLQGKSQHTESFSSDPLVYLEEITKFMDHPLYKDESKDFINSFSSLWVSEKISQEQQKNIYHISNAFLTLKARPYPDFYNYFKCLQLFINHKDFPSHYINWEKGLLQMIGNKKIKLGKINNYLKHTQNLLKSNIIYQSRSTQWISSNANFQYQFTDQVYIIFEETNLTCLAQKDSTRILNTRGIYYPMENRWEGKQGKITWERAGFSPDKVFAELDTYQLDMRLSKFTIDTVTFFNSRYFSKPLKGRLEEKVMHVNNPTKAIYPRFESFHKRIDIKDIAPNVDYNGGVAIHGAKLIGKGSPLELANIYLFRRDTLFLTASCEHFTIREDRIIGNNTRISLKLDTNIIYHPGLLFKYFTDKKELNLIREGDGLSKSPYFNNYHNIIMDFELLSWNMGNTNMYFKMMHGGNKREAIFESLNYFDLSRYHRLQGLDKVHPLVSLRKYSDYIYSKSFTALEYANYIKKSVHQVRQLILELSFMGFLSYNIKTDEVIIQNRLHDYLRAGIGKQDYDVISFTSTTSSSQDNAILNLENYNITINGVRNFTVSDSQNVVIYPKNNEVILKQNRDFKFDGKITAGLFEMYGNDFFFSYKDFKVDLYNMDSMKMNILQEEKDIFGKKQAVRINNKIEIITGNLLIDDPDNKSGLDDHPQYPVFKSTKNSYVYYDRPDIQNGVYHREKFYFRIDPYTIENINSLHQEDLKLDGTFVSDSIFPDFKETLTLQEDFSLGFETKAPTEGYLAYNKGKYFNKISLDNKGLKGEGTLQYLASTTESEHFIFLPKEMKANAKRFHLKGETESTPEIQAKQIQTTWLPYTDQLIIESQKEPIKMFDQQASFLGSLKLNPEELTGSGIIKFDEATITSNLFLYTHHTIDADTSNFTLLDTIQELIAFQTEGVRSHINLAERKGDFINIKTNSFVNFPANEYICYMNSFSWYMDKKLIDIGINDDKLSQAWSLKETGELPSLKQNKFISTNIDQDSLSFETPHAQYNLENNIISAQYVEQIRVADALILPKDGKLVIEPEAHIQSIQEAKIIADTLNNHHQLYDAIVNIYGKNSFSGSAQYNYIDMNKRVQRIVFDTIYVDTTGQTFATGNLNEEKSFSLSPAFDFKGKVQLKAREKHLIFDGAARIHNNCEVIKDNWIHFTSLINPNQVMIPIGEQINNDKEHKIYNSFFLTNDSTRIYSSFLSERSFYTDNVLIKAQGFLTYKEQEKSYIIGSEEKLSDPKKSGDVISFSQKNCTIRGEGLLSLGTDLGQIGQVSVGSIEHKLDSNKIRINILLGLDFFFSEPALKIMEEQFKSIPQQENRQDSIELIKNLAQLMGNAPAQEAILQMNSNGIFKKLPKELTHNIFFNKLNLEWDKTNKAYQSNGLLGLGNINKTQINKLIKGKFVLQKRRSGNRLTMYFELEKEKWFFFEYHHGVLFALSSNEKFNNIIHNLKPEKRTIKETKSSEEDPYSFILAPRSKLTRFKKLYNL